ncbi:unnamed protein product [Effrenium voratum]|nr:unnamed protein product [Effrenium voratum]
MESKRLKSDEGCHISQILLSEEKLTQLTSSRELVDDALAWSVARGIVMYPTCDKSQASAVPFALLPCPVPEDCFHLAKRLAPDFQLLMDKVSCDLAWLQSALAKTGAIDEICCKLLDICRSVYSSDTGKDPARDIRLHLMRNDFMLDTQKEHDVGFLCDSWTRPD